MTNPVTQVMLELDPLQLAEDITGKSYKTSEETSILGMLLTMQHGQQKKEHLLGQGDTTLCNELDRYQAIITDLGFEQVLVVPFTVKGWRDTDPDRNEHLYVYALREKGIILVFDTYDGVRVNGGHFYYCWVPNNEKCRADNVRATSSGGYRLYAGVDRFDAEDKDYYWVGYHDCREALRHHIGQLEEYGSFIPVWPEGHGAWLWLLHHGDTRHDTYDHSAITQRRLLMLPQWVQDMINVASIRK